MNPLSKIGATIVIFALASYSVAIFTEQRKRIVNQIVILFLSIGVILDITATTFMILGTTKGPFTLHGFLGYSSLLGMIIDTFLIWQLRLKFGINAPVSKSIHLYSRLAYSWWVLAFITGGLLVAMR